MAVTTACTLQVPLPALRRGLLAVVPHAAPVRLGDEDLVLSRVRLVAGKTELHVLATNADRTSACASLPILDDSRAERFATDDGVFTLDVHPKMVRSIARDLTPRKASEDDDDQGVVELALTTDTITVTDVSGLWPGTSRTVTTLGHRDDFPDVMAVIGRALYGAAGTYKPLVTDADPVRQFVTAAKAYEEPLVVAPTGTAESRGFVVECGEQFVGTLESGHTRDSLGRRDAVRRANLERFGAGLRAVS